MIANTDKEAIRTAYEIMSRIPESEYMDWDRDIGNGITVLLEKPQDYTTVEVMVVVKDTELEYESPTEYTNSLRTISEDMETLCDDITDIVDKEEFNFLCDPYDDSITQTDYWKGYCPYDHWIVDHFSALLGHTNRAIQNHAWNIRISGIIRVRNDNNRFHNDIRRNSTLCQIVWIGMN